MRGIFALCLLPAVLARPLETDTAVITTGPGTAPLPTGTAPASYSVYSSYPIYRNGSCFTHSSYIPLSSGTAPPYPTASSGFKHHPHFDIDFSAREAEEGHVKRFEGARKHDAHGPWLPYEPEANHHPHPHEHPHPRPTGTGIPPTGTGVLPTGTVVYPTATGVFPTDTPYGYHPLPTYFLDGLRHEAKWLS